MKIANLTIAFHPAGYPFMAAFAGVAVVLAFVSGKLFLVALLLTAWCFYFFRDPERVTPTRSGLVVSPADGFVVAVREVIPEGELGLGSDPRMRISIFLNVFDVHVNRIPASGIITDTRYRAGKFLNAALDKASVDNERMTVALKLAGDHPFDGRTLGVVQIAGLVARRIVCNAHIDQNVQAGERYGIIRFGSRADIYLPSGLNPLVVVGQYMIGGETVLADCVSNEAQRQGVAR